MNERQAHQLADYLEDLVSGYGRSLRDGLGAPDEGAEPPARLGAKPAIPNARKEEK